MGQKIISRAPELLTIAERSGAPASLVTQAKDEAATPSLRAQLSMATRHRNGLSA
jgi:hypothetical protein